MTTNSKDYFKEIEDFPTLTNDQYIKLHEAKDFQAIVANSMRLVTKIINRYNIHPQDNEWKDCLQAGIEKVAEITPNWNPKISKFSTFTFWPIHKGIQQFLCQRNTLSFGCYETYRKESLPPVNLKAKIQARRGNNLTLEDVLPSLTLNPIQDILIKEHNNQNKLKIEVITKYLEEIDVKATFILFSNLSKSIEDDDIAYLLDVFHPHFNKTHTQRILITKQDLVSSSRVMNRMVGYWRKHLRKLIIDVLDEHEEEWDISEI